MKPAVIALRDIGVRYGGADVLDVPSLDLFAGEVLAVIGPNGSGKSTLLRVAGLLERPTRGTVSFHGAAVDASRSLAERRRMATVLQQPLLADMAGEFGLSAAARMARPSRVRVRYIASERIMTGAKTSTASCAPLTTTGPTCACSRKGAGYLAG